MNTATISRFVLKHKHPISIFWGIEPARAVAAFVPILAFVAMASAPDTTVKTIATGLGAGIFIDALIVRTLLVPATVSLMGHWNWWLPTWLGRIVPAPMVDRRARTTPGLRSGTD